MIDFLRQVFDFCIKHWKVLTSLVCALILVVFYIIRKRPSYNAIDSIKEDVLEILPTLINSVEIDGNGQRKKMAVIEAVKSYVQKKYSLELPEGLLFFIDSAIESILSTPQKKGKD